MSDIEQDSAPSFAGDEILADEGQAIDELVKRYDEWAHTKVNLSLGVGRVSLENHVQLELR